MWRRRAPTSQGRQAHHPLPLRTRSANDVSGSARYRFRVKGSVFVEAASATAMDEKRDSRLACKGGEPELKGERRRRFAGRRHGARGTRTPDLLGAIQALSQLSYSP